MTLKNLTLIHGDAVDGGGNYNRGSLTIINSLLTGNSAADEGGGIYNAGALSIVESTLTDNSAAEGWGGFLRYRIF